jgi:hypothetical protein
MKRVIVGPISAKIKQLDLEGLAYKKTSSELLVFFMGESA